MSELMVIMGVFGMGKDLGSLSGGGEKMLANYSGTLGFKWKNEESKGCWGVLSSEESSEEKVFLMESKKSVGLDKSFKVCPTNSVSHARLYSLKKCKVRVEMDFICFVYKDSIVPVVGGGILNISDYSSYSVPSGSNSVALNYLFYNSLSEYSKFYFMKFNQFGVTMWSFFISVEGKESCLPLNYRMSSSPLSEDGLVTCFSGFGGKSIYSYSSFLISSHPFCPKKKLKSNL